MNRTKSAGMEAVVLAGGLGTRLRPVTGEIPKPMVSIAGRPFLDYLLGYWKKLGVTRFILSVAYQYHMITDHFGREFHGVPIDYAVDEGWGTGGGTAAAAALRKEKDRPFLVINGDTFFEVALADFLSFHQSKRAKATMALTKVADPGRYGKTELSGQGNVVSFDAPASGPSEINGGIYLFEPDFLETYKQPRAFSLEKDLFTKAAADGILYGYSCGGRFIDIGTPESYLECAKWFQQEEKNHA